MRKLATGMRPLCPSLLSLNLGLALGSLLSACGTQGTEAPLCDSKATTCEFAHDFGATTLAAGQEIDWQCNSWTLNNPTDLYVQAVDFQNDGAHHHSNWFFVPDINYQHEDGKWDCNKVHFTELGAALLGGVIFAQSTQSQKEVQRLPQGAVVRIPAYSRIIGAVHLLNPKATSVTTGLRMKLSTLPGEQAQIRLSPLRLTYSALRIPPRKKAEFTGRCDLRAEYQTRRKDPFALKLYYVLPHYHELGKSFRLRTMGGPNSGAALYDLKDGYGEATGKTFDPPIDLSSADGVEFTCGFENPRDKEVGWGIGDQEMCVMLGFIQSRVAYDADVEGGQAIGEEEGVVKNTGPCGVAAFNFDAG